MAVHPRSPEELFPMRKTIPLRLEALEDRCTPTAGDLDPTFGTGGIVTTSFTGANDKALDAVIQPTDGKIVVAGFHTAGYDNADFLLARYNADGSLDAGFGSGGHVFTD